MNLLLLTRCCTSDTDGNMQITIEDVGPKVLFFGLIEIVIV